MSSVVQRENLNPERKRDDEKSLLLQENSATRTRRGVTDVAVDLPVILQAFRQRDPVGNAWETQSETRDPVGNA